MQANNNGNVREHWTDERLDRLADTVERYIIASGERMTELEQGLQAISRDVAALVNTQQAAAKEREELRQATLGIANLLASLDEDRPTILRKLTAIENKVDRLLGQQ